jgi:hypothetical protein
MKLNWGQGIFLFFVVFVSLGISFIIFSLRQNNDLVSNDYYEKGADYTHQMEINSRSFLYNDSINLANRNNLLIVRFSKSIDLMADTMDVVFYRPSDKRFDHEFRMALKSDSIEIVKSGLQKGRFKVKFQWTNNMDVFMVEKEFFVE